MIKLIYIFLITYVLHIVQSNSIKKSASNLDSTWKAYLKNPPQHAKDIYLNLSILFCSVTGL